MGLQSGLKSLDWQALAKDRSKWRSHVDKQHQDSCVEYFQQCQQQRLVRKGAVAGQYKCPIPGCSFTHDKLCYVKSHVSHKHTEAAIQRQRDRAERVAAAMPGTMTAFPCPVCGCGKILERDTTSLNAQWNGLRIHLARVHKTDKQQQDAQIEQLEGIPRLARSEYWRQDVQLGSP